MHRSVYIIFFALILVPLLAIGQPTDPDTDPDVPITGIEILVTAGAIFGVKKLLGKFKQK